MHQAPWDGSVLTATLAVAVSVPTSQQRKPRSEKLRNLAPSPSTRPGKWLSRDSRPAPQTAGPKVWALSTPAPETLVDWFGSES